MPSSTEREPLATDDEQTRIAAGGLDISLYEVALHKERPTARN